jgi:hypothetical protein
MGISPATGRNVDREKRTPQETVQRNTAKGKPPERAGRKARGLRRQRYAGPAATYFERMNTLKKRRTKMLANKQKKSDPAGGAHE